MSMRNEMTKMRSWEDSCEAGFPLTRCSGTAGSDSSQDSDGQPDTSSSPISMVEDNSDDEEPELLEGKENDPLIPSRARIDATLHYGLTTWASIITSTKRGWPPGLSEPSLMLHDLPALPDQITGRLTGYPVWRVPDFDQSTKCKRGAEKEFLLSVPNPFQLQVALTRQPPCDCLHPNLLLITTSCWSYILSANLLERQGRSVYYTDHYLQPVVRHDTDGQGRSFIHLPPSTSPRLLRWICALLAPTPGWCASTGKIPPWATTGPGNLSIIIHCSGTTSPIDEPAPTSSQAKELLVELCSLCELESLPSNKVPPYTAGFLAALALPFYLLSGLKPGLPMPSLSAPKRRNVRKATKAKILDDISRLYRDMPYYMTLSMTPRGVGAMVWSVFWQPDIECDVVSPWLASIRSLLDPIIQARDMDQLARVFACRRPRISLMWYGIILLGDLAIVDQICNYLEILDERPSHGSVASPDFTVAAWTGSPQSFWDMMEEPCPDGISRKMSRADLLRRRQNLQLHDDLRMLFSWRPFGDVDRVEVEPEDFLELHYSREYVKWTWKTARGTYDHYGYRNVTKISHQKSCDSLELLGEPNPSESVTALPPIIKLRPSKKATLAMISHSMRDCRQDRSLDIAAISNLSVAHPWLKGWRGLE